MSSTVITPIMSLPTPPRNPLSGFGLLLQESLNPVMVSIDHGISKEDESRDDFFRQVKMLHALQNDLAHAVRSGMVESIPGLLESNEATLLQLVESINGDECARESKLGFLIEKSRATLLLHHFFQEGKVATQSSLQPCNDNEYIGAVLSFAQSLNQYALGVACEGDVASIELCLGVLAEVNAKMLEFDFRNGPLRRKYDGLKYALRSMEDILFELSLQSPCATEVDAAGVQEEECSSPTKRMRLEESVTSASAAEGGPAAAAVFKFIDAAEIDAIRQRMDRYDQLRELVIKDSRDVQKLAKQAVFAVIRGQLGEAHKKLDQAAVFAKKILETVNQHPTLRQGSFSNSLEEWAEGALTLAWVEHKRILSPEELGLVNSAEYVGALSDFTGEIGRLAVMHAGKRDFAAVREIYQADLVLANAISRLSGNRFAKKLEMVQTNLRKVSDVIYELSMLQRSGRATRTKPVDLNVGVSEAGAKGASEDC
uniref:Uncharacterized protein n=1 Tax=Spumella elongata TaxID=89044 RepID=A0A7S3H6D8_9STRA